MTTSEKQPAPRKEADYSHRSLKDKLGLKEGMVAAVIEAPPGYAALLDTDAFDTELDQSSYAFLHFFTTSMIALRDIFPILASRLEKNGMLWISWPKKASKMPTDLNDNVVRDIGLVAGLVDVKVCAVDETWSGIKFVYRVKDR